MRHRKKDSKLGRSSAHKKATLASLVRGLIQEKRIKTTLAKAKQARRLAEKMVTLGRKCRNAPTPEEKLAARRRAVAILATKKHVTKLVDEIVPELDGRQGGYTRIVRLGRRKSDGSEMAVLEWIDTAPPENKKRKDASDKAAA